MDSPLAIFSRIRSTVMRVPAITGLPIITAGSEVISFWLIWPTLYRFNAATAATPWRKNQPQTDVLSTVLLQCGHSGQAVENLS